MIAIQRKRELAAMNFANAGASSPGPRSASGLKALEQ
jgi:hypothetical protein